MENRPFADGLFLAVRERFYRWTFRFTASSQRKQHRHVSTCVSHKCPQHGMTRTPRKITQLMRFLPYIPIMSLYIYIYIFMYVYTYIYIYELYIYVYIHQPMISKPYSYWWCVYPNLTNDQRGCRVPAMNKAAASYAMFDGSKRIGE